MVRLSWIGRASALLAVGLATMALAACSDYGGSLPKAMRPLDQKTQALIERKGMDLRAPILIRIYKEDAKLEVWKLQKATNRYAFLKDFDICAWSGVLGPKVKEGDRQAPEGFYTIRPAQMNPDSNYYLSFNIGYPNEFDRSLGRTGSELMVHGACSSAGCYSMTDDNIQEIYTLGRLAFQGGQREFQVEAFPFRMTPENMAKHRNDPNIAFWMMLKEGSDHFDITGQPPKVDVCDHRYIFDSVPGDGRSFDPSGACPPMSMPEPIRTAVADQEAKDNAKMLEIAERLDHREGQDGAAALRLALATPTSVERSTPLAMSVAGTVSLEPQTTASVEPPTSSDQAPAAGTPAAGTPVAVTPAAAAAAPAASTTAIVETPPPPTPRPAPASVAAAAPAPSAEPSTTAAADAGFLPVPDLRTSVTDAPAANASANGSPDAATLQERMLAGSAPPDSSVANSYASAATEDEGLTGMVLRLIKKKQAGQADGVGTGN